MKMQQVSDSCFAVVNEKNRMFDANSGLVNRGGGVVVDTQPDLHHARRMIELFGKVWPRMPQRVINTHEDGDHVWGNQLFADAEIIAHRTVRKRMRDTADPRPVRQLLHDTDRAFSRWLMGLRHPGALAAARQIRQDFDFGGIEIVLPTTLFDERHVLDLEGMEVHLIYVGRSDGDGAAIVHIPRERVLFAGDAVFCHCTPLSFSRTYEKWLAALDLIVWLDPDVIVPGHGPVCGIEGAMETKAYLEYVREESQRCFAGGFTSLEAAKRIDLGPYASWHCAGRVYANVERAYRDFRNDPPEAPWDLAATFDGIYQVARARGIDVEF